MKPTILRYVDANGREQQVEGADFIEIHQARHVKLIRVEAMVWESKVRLDHSIIDCMNCLYDRIEPPTT